MASDAKPASPAAEDPPADDAMDAEPEGKEEAEAEEKQEAEEQEEEEEEEPQTERKRGRRKKGSAEKPAPATPTVERPSRERKTVERYAELTPRVTPAKKAPAILQGSGTKLKDIPNVSFKLSKRKVDENLQSLHTLMFGRKSNVHFLKRNISQFSGFVWTDNQDKHRTRIKEKLDKFNKEKLLDFCETLDIHVKATMKKEEVSAKLLEFLETPCITRDVVLTGEKKGKKRGRESKGSGKATAEGASEEKKRRKSRKQAVETEKENDDEDDAGPAGSEDASMGEEDEDDKEHAGSEEEPDETPAKKSTDAKQRKKKVGSKAKENDASGKKACTKPAKGVSKSVQHTKEDEPDVELESKKVGKKAAKGSSKESNVPVDKANNKVSKMKKDDGKEGQSNNSGALNNKASKKQGAKASNENKGKGKGSTGAGSTPTTKQSHAVVSDILKEVVHLHGCASLRLPQPFSVSGRWQSAMTAAAEADGGRKADVLVRDDAPKLLAALKEMKDGLDLVRSKVESLTRKVRKNQLPTGDGIGYLEAKHHLLLSYCQDLVYYLLRKAKGLSVDGHPVVCSLVEIRLFLEKIRPIDKKMEYQIQKLTNAAEGAAAQEKVLNSEVKGKGEQRGEEDLLKYRPNPDMMDSKFAPDGQDNDGLYRPPKFVPASMDDKRQKDASRRDRALARMATENPYIKEIIDDAADRPEEWKETVGDESKEFVNYMRQREKQEKQEEELFTRAPVTKREKYMEKQMKKQLHGLRGLTDGFDLGMNMLLDGDKEDGGGSSEPHGKSVGQRKHQKGKKRKRH